MSDQPILCPCGEPSDGWPGDNGAELCQMCWEAHCDETWWEMLPIFQAIEEAYR